MDVDNDALPVDDTEEMGWVERTVKWIINIFTF